MIVLPSSRCMLAPLLSEFAFKIGGMRKWKLFHLTIILGISYAVHYVMNRIFYVGIVLLFDRLTVFCFFRKAPVCCKSSAVSFITY